MEHELESAPRDNTRRTIVVRSITRLAVFILKLLYAGCVTFCRRHTPVCAAVVVSLSIGGGGGHGVTALPLRSQQAATLLMWRPARRVDARRYVKDQGPLFLAERENHIKSPQSRQAEIQFVSYPGINGEEFYLPWRFYLLKMIIGRQNG